MSRISKLKVVALVAAVLAIRRQRREQQKKRLWVKPWNEKRFELGIYCNLLKELECDEQNYRRYARMNHEQFEDLPTRV